MEIKLKSPDKRIEMLSIFRKFKDDRDIKYFMKRLYKHKFRKNFGRGKNLHHLAQQDDTFGLYYMQNRVKKLHYWTYKYRYELSLSRFADPAFKEDEK